MNHALSCKVLYLSAHPQVVCHWRRPVSAKAWTGLQCACGVRNGWSGRQIDKEIACLVATLIQLWNMKHLWGFKWEREWVWVGAPSPAEGAAVQATVSRVTMVRGSSVKTGTKSPEDWARGFSSALCFWYSALTALGICYLISFTMPPQSHPTNARIPTTTASYSNSTSAPYSIIPDFISQLLDKIPCEYTSILLLTSLNPLAWVLPPSASTTFICLCLPLSTFICLLSASTCLLPPWYFVWDGTLYGHLFHPIRSNSTSSAHFFPLNFHLLQVYLCLILPAFLLPHACRACHSETLLCWISGR